MPEEVKPKRGRPPKNKEQVVETNNVSSIPEHGLNDNLYEFNSYYASMKYGTSVSTGSGIDFLSSIFSCGVYDYFTKQQIHNILSNPIENHEDAILLSEFVYGKNGTVSNSIDYMTALPCLDRIVTSKRKNAAKSKVKKNKELMQSTLKTIDDKRFIRDALFTNMLDGIAFYYFETRVKTPDNQKFMNDYDVNNISEINELGINASIITLPWKYTKIVGKKNGRYVLAFNLSYFNDFEGESLNKKLKKYPLEIVNAYNEWHKKGHTGGNWYVLNSDKTMCRKIKCKDSEPWGRGLVIAALEDVLYKDYFIDTKRNVLDEVNNKFVYQTLPEGQTKGSCALTKTQQEQQHNVVKQAITTKNSRGSTSFATVSAGTKINSIDVNTDIFDSKNESDLTNTIAQDLGICASLIGAMTTGNFASSQSNLEMLTAQLYTWVYEWQAELNHVINKNIIKDEKNAVEVYYFPTSFVNRKSFFDMTRSLFLEAGGSLSFFIASAGIDVDTYLSVLDEEIADGIFDKYKPHMTSFTLSSKSNENDNKHKIDNPTNENTIKSQSNNSNALPRPSDNK